MKWLLRFILAGIGCLVVWFIYICVADQMTRNHWKKYGVEYKYAQMSSPTLDAVDFFINSEGGPIPGPTIMGDALEVSYEEIDKDGVDEIVLRSDVYPEKFVYIKILLKDGKASGFRILDRKGFAIIYPEAGFREGA